MKLKVCFADMGGRLSKPAVEGNGFTERLERQEELKTEKWMWNRGMPQYAKGPFIEAGLRRAGED
jgi:hypothetical protein